MRCRAEEREIQELRTQLRMQGATMNVITRRSFAGWLTTVIIAGAMGSAEVPTFAPELRAATTSPHWAGTWATALVARPQAQPAQATPSAAPLLNFKDQTLRQIVRVSIGGDRLRVVLSNAFGTAPLAIGAAHVGVRQKDAAIGRSLRSRHDLQRESISDHSSWRRAFQRPR